MRVVTRSSTWRSWVTSDQPAPVGGQPLLQPGDGVDVEVVGRLVEQQQVGLAGEEPGQRHPFGLAARQGGRSTRRRSGAHAQPVEQRGRLPPVADRGGHRAGAAAAAPGRAGRSARRGPDRTAPSCGTCSPASTRSRVDLPVPLMPTTPSRSPLRTVSDSPRNRSRPGPAGAEPLGVDEDHGRPG